MCAADVGSDSRNPEARRPSIIAVTVRLDVALANNLADAVQKLLYVFFLLIQHRLHVSTGRGIAMLSSCHDAAPFPITPRKWR
jgi:hypothetical protein